MICIEMLLLSIGAGMAFHYSEFITDEPLMKGSIFSVIKSSLLDFMKDFRLINPHKKWGFTPKADTDYLRESQI